jgi:hypothetical protein
MSQEVVANIDYLGIKCLEESAVDGFFSDSDEIFLTASFSNLQGRGYNYTSEVHTDVDTGEYHQSSVRRAIQMDGTTTTVIGATTSWGLSFESSPFLVLNEEGISSIAVVMDLWEEDNEELVLSGEYTETFLKGLEKAFNEHTKKDGLLPKNVASAFASLASTYARINNGFKNDHIGSHQFLILIDTVKKEIIIDQKVYPLSRNTIFSLEFTAQKQGGSYRADFCLNLDIQGYDLPTVIQPSVVV